MIKVSGRKIIHPQGFAHTVNANKNGKFTKGGYGLNINGVPLNQHGTNPFKN